MTLQQRTLWFTNVTFTHVCAAAEIWPSYFVGYAHRFQNVILRKWIAYTPPQTNTNLLLHIFSVRWIFCIWRGGDNKWETLENNIKFRSSGQSKIFCSNRVVLILLTDVTYRLEIQELLLGVKMNLVSLVTEATTDTRCNILKSTTPSEGSQYSNEHLFKITCSTQSTRWYWMKLENKGKRPFCCSWVGLRMLR
jgi:hypothetical protein